MRGTKMRIAAASMLLCAFASAGPLRAQDDVVMKAMRDEMNRSMQKLRLENLDKPYFISYRVVEQESTGVGAEFGALTHSSQGHSRRFSVEVRVGDYSLDNTNLLSFDFDFSSMTGIFNGNAELPLDNNYQELRRQIWLATDSSYKKALEDLSRKHAALENKVDSERIPDFSKESPTTTTMDAAPVRVDRAAWEAQARSLSGLFRQMPNIYTSSVAFSASNSYIRFLSSEGTSYTRQEPRVTFSARAATQASDGTPLDDSMWLYASSLSGLPSPDALAAKVRALGRRLTDLRSASEVATYNGPLLVEGDAAPQLFRSVFLTHLLGTRRPLISGPAFMSQQTNQAENLFLDEIGARVLPDFLTVVDNPTLAEYKNTPLPGACKVDDDGVPCREVLLVDKGILQTLLVTRDPVRGMPQSTGSRHAGQVAPSSVFVSAQNGLSEADLKARFLAMVKQRNKDYGIVVRRLRNAQHPLLAYKVFPDGHEELIRGAQLAELNLSSFKDIVAASEDQNLLTVEFRGQTSLESLISSISSGDEGYAPVTLAVPSLLFDDVTVRKVRGERSTLPVLPHPYFDHASQ